jgi:hypothetical protein
MPAYIKFEDVRARLVGKVRFVANPEDDPNRMSEILAKRLIDEAEGQVELDLSPRYAVPFAHKTTGKYDDLPARPTKNIIRLLCELQAVMRILETDFGSGSTVDGQKYIVSLEKRYKKVLEESVMGKLTPELESSRQWKLPPLPELMKSYNNTEADDGFAGFVSVTSRGEGSFGTENTSDPSENWINAHFGDTDGHDRGG